VRERDAVGEQRGDDAARAATEQHLLGDDRGVDRVTALAADLLREGDAEQPGAANVACSDRGSSPSSSHRSTNGATSRATTSRASARSARRSSVSQSVTRNARVPDPGVPRSTARCRAHSSAASPVATSARSSRCRRWVTSRQKSRAGPVTRCSASAFPNRHVSPSGAVSASATSTSGACRPRTA
jgi:hypothetical protein